MYDVSFVLVVHVMTTVMFLSSYHETPFTTRIRTIYYILSQGSQEETWGRVEFDKAAREGAWKDCGLQGLARGFDRVELHYEQGTL
jgi:hypothetical protein